MLSFESGVTSCFNPLPGTVPARSQLSEFMDRTPGAAHQVHRGPGTSARAESTAYLRNRLQFHDEVRWKRFSTRRLELINALRLDENKASKQEREIRNVAKILCDEFEYSSSAIRDFEKLVRLGVQSVRRNRHRPTKTGSLPTTSFEVMGSAAPSQPVPSSSSPAASAAPVMRQLPQNMGAALGLLAELGSEVGVAALPATWSLLAAGALRLALGLALQPLTHDTLSAGMLASFESGPLGEEIARLTHSSNFNSLVAIAATRDYVATVCALRVVSTDLLAHNSTIAGMAQHLRTLEQSQAIPAPGPRHGQQPSGPNTPVPSSSYTNPAPLPNPLQHRMQAPVMYPITVQQQVRNPQVRNPQQIRNPQQARNPQPLVPHTIGLPAVVPPAAPVGPGPMWADRLVTITYGDRVMELSFSPLKSSPPSLQEMLEPCRASFNLASNTVLMIRHKETQRLIETNADLADALLQDRVHLEIFIPPKSTTKQAPPHQFSPVAPTVRR